MGRLRLAAVACVCALSLAAAPASLAGWAGPDPSSNFAVNPSCASGAACLGQAIDSLDQARAALGQAPYALPSDFAELNPAEQAFVLTNLDRLQYGLRPITGVTGALDQLAASGVVSDQDPVSSAPNVLTVTSNWGGGYADFPLAYAAWMYDDGPGSDNLDCLAADDSGCWSHRHDVLWSFGAGPLAMGAAAGTDGRGVPGAAMVIVQGDGSYDLSYVYTWSQALAAGAGPGAASTTSDPLAGISRVGHRRHRHRHRHRHRRHRHRHRHRRR